jgi:excinuclease ABC subunit C
MDSPNLKDLIDPLPHTAGVYLMKDARGQILYVGKAKDLKKRLASYLKADSPKITALLEKVDLVDYLVTANEKEALILESNLIKKHRPRYNVVLRDDKRYPCLRLAVTEPFPRLHLVRRIRKDQALYFGPFSLAGKMRETVYYLQKLFPLRQCRQKELPHRSRPCLYYQTGKCPAPCHGKISLEDYRQRVREVVLFFEGRNQELLRDLKRQMRTASEALEFEKAAFLRDRIQAITETLREQKVVSPRFVDVDVLALEEKEESIEAVILFIRLGSVTGLARFNFPEVTQPLPEVLSGLIQQYYQGGKYIPQRILIPFQIEDALVLEEVLSEMKGQKVELLVPQRGEGRRWMALAEENVANYVRRKEPEREFEDRIARPLQKKLHLKSLPLSLGALDISNLQGDLAVGSWVVFKEGLPEKSSYRRYKIRQVNQPNDIAMMEEMITRLVPKETSLPDLILVDGGKGQLNVLKKWIDQLPPDQQPDLMALAKKTFQSQGGKDGIYLPNRKNPVRFSTDSPLLLFLERVRDEAHRFAITYHHKLQEKALRPDKKKPVPVTPSVDLE